MSKKITVGILAYNHEKFIEECLLSVLSLKYENLEIIISDDASTDRTFEIITKLLENCPTNHTVIQNRNIKNIGLAGNFNKVFFELATGEYYVTLGGDDKIKEDYFSEALGKFQENKEIMMCDFSAIIINENSEPQEVKINLDFDNRLFDVEDYYSLSKIETFAPGRIIRSNLVKDFDPISLNCPTEDSVLMVRALLLGKIMRINKKVIYYRKHTSNISGLDSMKKISNLRIISQYISDVLHLYEKNVINEAKVLKLINRFQLEFKLRETLFSNKGFVTKAILLRIHKLKYYLLDR